MGRLAPIGVVLAGGRGRRLGGAKATVELGGRPLIAYPLDALSEALEEVVVLTKAGVELPWLAAGRVWIERSRRQHPLVGLIEALAFAGGRPVVVCSLDLPLVTPELVARLVSARPQEAAVVVRHAGEIQPLLGRYGPSALEPLRAAAGDFSVGAREAVMAIGPRLLEVEDPDLLLNVNTPEDAERAVAALQAREVSRRSPTSSAQAGRSRARRRGA